MLGIGKIKANMLNGVAGAQETLYKVLIIILAVSALLWLSIFLYATFYYSYIPPVSHSRPVHLQFSRECDRNSRMMCNFPSANVTLTRREKFLMVGQPYKILLELEMPESSANHNLGMFMVCARLRAKNGDMVESGCRSALVQYKSPILRLISTIIFYPFLFSGSLEEKQMLSVELFSNFQEDRNNPITDASIEIQSYSIEIYKATLRIHAHFTGLRFLMFNWPLTSATMGISTNLFFLSIITFLSWYKFFRSHQKTLQVGYDAAAANILKEQEEATTNQHRLKGGSVEILTKEEQDRFYSKIEKADADLTPDIYGNEDEVIENKGRKYSGIEEDDQIVPDIDTRSTNDSNVSEESDLIHETKTSVTPSSTEFEVIGSEDDEGSSKYVGSCEEPYYEECIAPEVHKQ